MKRRNYSGRESVRTAHDCGEGKTDYHSLHFDGKMWIRVLAEGLAADAFLTLFFYRSWIAFLLLLAGLKRFIHKRRVEMAQRRRQQLALQFKELLSAAGARMQGGASAENAFCGCQEEMTELFGPDSCIVSELHILQKGITNQRPLEELLWDFSVRSGVEEIEEFAGIFVLAKRTGGNMQRILGRSIRLVTQRLEVKREIRSFLGARQMEQKIMNLVPFGILTYVELTSPGYFNILYHNAAGAAIMSICLVVYLAAYRYAEKLVAVNI